MQLRKDEAAKTVGTRNYLLASLKKSDISKLKGSSWSFHQNSSTIMETENSDDGQQTSGSNLRHKFDIMTIYNMRTPHKISSQQDAQGWLSAKNKKQTLN